MSMDQAPENNLPPGTGLRLGGDWTRERDALRKQVAACEADNTALRAECDELHRLLDTGYAAAAQEQATLRAELARVTDQWQQAEAHNNDVNAELAAVRTWAQEAQRAATNRLAQGSPDPRYWQGQTDAAAAVWTLVKPVI